MYKKKDKKVMVIAAVVVVLFIAVIYIVPNFSAIFGGGDVQEETEIAEYEVLIHKTDAGRIDVKKALLKSDSDNETKLTVKPGTLVSLNVTPRKNKALERVSVVDAKDFSNEFGTIVNETKDNTYTVDFSMPEKDVVMTFTFTTLETEPETEKKTEAPQTETESETEKGNPYGLRVHGITADLITSFNGQFDDRDFCEQLGDALHLDSPRSAYYGITDVTFSRDPYTGEKDADKVYYFIYFGEDPEDKMLATYYLKDSSYVFTKYAEPETSAPEDDGDDNGGAETQSSPAATGMAGSTGTAGYSTSSSGSRMVASFDILQVSKVFLDYCGGQETFYQKAFDYVLSKGLTGSITGTMSSYDIDADKRKATITIKLNSGGSFTGTYDKDKNTFSFSGL